MSPQNLLRHLIDKWILKFCASTPKPSLWTHVEESILSSR
ncbi:hypothetical protein SLEP1_g10363 [Rubroshorea leprosula]|uniref:Uncharacterized protein n=1 Tax=Rubroshorea leprosula TaxID=152421 RepID=A0AAV5IFT9_9ROSI|nr:hypothetical protein SLEP1_g10363 [Rubroshorea leprosula]